MMLSQFEKKFAALTSRLASAAQLASGEPEREPEPQSSAGGGWGAFAESGNQDDEGDEGDEGDEEQEAEPEMQQEEMEQDEQEMEEEQETEEEQEDTEEQEETETQEAAAATVPAWMEDFMDVDVAVEGSAKNENGCSHDADDPLDGLSDISEDDKSNVD